jgi:hypothetical protein
MGAMSATASSVIRTIGPTEGNIRTCKSNLVPSKTKIRAIRSTGICLLHKPPAIAIYKTFVHMSKSMRLVVEFM